MSAMEKRAETSESYLFRIAKTIGHNKRKRGGDDDEDDSSDDPVYKTRSMHLYYSYSTSEALVRIGLNWYFQTIQFTSKGLLGKL